MSKPTPKDLLKIIMMNSYESVKHHEKLIEKWNDPQDVVQRAAVIILNIHQMYGKMAFGVFKMLQNNCKHPKKMRDLCADGTVYCMDCNADLTEDEIFSTKTSTLMKEKILSRRKIVKKYAKQKMTQLKIAQKLNVSLSTIEKDMVILRS